MKQAHGSRILFVEDSEEDFTTASRAFNKSGIINTIDRVKTGDAAISYLEARIQSGHDMPGLILLDLNLPGLDGREVLKHLKANEKLKLIPVIVLTTSSDERDVNECYKHGANSYIQKPVEFKNFVEAMSHLKEYWFEISILPKAETDD